jgi:hypothetical protein
MVGNYPPARKRRRLKVEVLRANQPGRFSVLWQIARTIYRRAQPTPRTGGF